MTPSNAFNGKNLHLWILEREMPLWLESPMNAMMRGLLVQATTSHENEWTVEAGILY
jgi:hypothetical protein